MATGFGGWVFQGSLLSAECGCGILPRNEHSRKDNSRTLSLFWFLVFSRQSRNHQPRRYRATRTWIAQHSSSTNVYEGLVDDQPAIKCEPHNPRRHCSCSNISTSMTDWLADCGSRKPGTSRRHNNTHSVLATASCLSPSFAGCGDTIKLAGVWLFPRNRSGPDTER